MEDSYLDAYWESQNEIDMSPSEATLLSWAIHNEHQGDVYPDDIDTFDYGDDYDEV